MKVKEELFLLRERIDDLEKTIIDLSLDIAPGVNKTCSNCKYWGKGYKDACGRTDFWPSLDKLKFELIYGAADETDLWAYLITGPDFGCVLFEEKEELKK